MNDELSRPPQALMKVLNARRVNFTQLRLKLAQAPSPSGGGGGGGGDGRVSSERASRSQRLRSLLFFSNARGGDLGARVCLLISLVSSARTQSLT